MKRQRKDCALKDFFPFFPVLETGVDIMGKKIKKQQMSCVTFTVIDTKQVAV